MSKRRAILIWAALGAAMGIPIALATTSPQLAWRDPIYISAGFAGIVAMALMLVQPLLAGRYLPGLTGRGARRVHRVIGGFLVSAVVIHVAALWITSPPDAIDALLFKAPTLFSVWGVLAMWTVFAAALVAAFRWRLTKRFNLGPRAWRLVHTSLATATVVLSVAHVLPIEGTMELVTKVMLCTLAVFATLKVVADLRIWRKGQSAPGPTRADLR
jgi:predicted ferric reductase